MGTFRSTPGAGYYDSLQSYREHVFPGATDKTLFEIVDRIGAANSVPWLTFVLGSGCLTPRPRALGTSAGELDDVVKSGLDAFGMTLGTWGLPRTTAFVRALIAKKLPDPGDTSWLIERSEIPEKAGTPWALATAATLIAALSTRVFAELMLEVPHVLGSADQEVIQYPDNSSATKLPLPATHASLIERLTEAQMRLDRLQRQQRASKDPSHGSVQAYVNLLKAVRDKLTGPRPELWRSQVEAMTAFAWYFLTDGTSIYPGWADMLHFQAANSSANKVEFTRVPFLRRPKVESLQPIAEDSPLIGRLRRVTERSWEFDEGARDEFYEGVAAILLQQAEIRSGRQRGRGSMFPLATAFNAAFDVELELALWAEMRKSTSPTKSFAVVIPVYNVDPDPKQKPLDADLHWLWCKVTPNDNSPLPQMLEEPADGSTGARGQWYAINTAKALSRELESLPIVVHLAGAPLFEIKHVFAEPSGDDDAARPAFRSQTRTHHGLLLDENMATIQFTQDVRGLPGQLHSEFIRSSDKNGPTAPRFWAFIGTQLADPAIRFRLIANELRSMGLADHETMIGDRLKGLTPGEEHSGVVVNAWVPPAEREVFRWHGYDVVQGKAQELLDDLKEFVDNVKTRDQSLAGVRTSDGA